jgi:nitrite reductase/ring-hydroxylating ferredoxin subunit
MSDLNRRDFVKVTAAGIGLLVLGSEIFADSAAGPIDVGVPADFPKGVVSDKLIASHNIIIVNEGDRIVALKATCTHKGAALSVANNQIVCNRHHSKFDDAGNPTAGPAKAALFRYGISLSDQGHLLVDKSKQFGQQQLDDPAAFVPIIADR